MKSFYSIQFACVFVTGIAVLIFNKQIFSWSAALGSDCDSAPVILWFIVRNNKRHKLLGKKFNIG